MCERGCERESVWKVVFTGMYMKEFHIKLYVI